MARLFNVTLAIFTVLLVRNEATRQDREKKLRKSQDVVKQQRFIEDSKNYGENLRRLVALLKTDTITVLCESGKINPVWCRYKVRSHLNDAFEQSRTKFVKKRRAASRLCWPGLPLPCNGLVPIRNARNVQDGIKSDAVFNLEARRDAFPRHDKYLSNGAQLSNDAYRPSNGIDFSDVKSPNNGEINDTELGKDTHPRTGADFPNDVDDSHDPDYDEEKRAMLKCRPGLVNCRNNGKRTIGNALEKSKPRDCPQGWMYCL